MIAAKKMVNMDYEDFLRCDWSHNEKYGLGSNLCGHLIRK